MINLPDNFIEVENVYSEMPSPIRYVNIDQIVSVIPLKREENETYLPEEYCRIDLSRNDWIEIKMTAQELFTLIAIKKNRLQSVIRLDNNSKSNRKDRMLEQFS
jgi:hypothetical protein